MQQPNHTKLWVDDKRRPPDDEWLWCRSFMDAVNAIITKSFEEFSLDHDLGQHEPTGYDLIRWVAYHKADRLPIVIRVHSDNPVGRENMISVIEHTGQYPYRTRYGVGYSQNPPEVK